MAGFQSMKKGYQGMSLGQKIFLWIGLLILGLSLWGISYVLNHYEEIKFQKTRQIMEKMNDRRTPNPSTQNPTNP